MNSTIAHYFGMFDETANADLSANREPAYAMAHAERVIYDKGAEEDILTVAPTIWLAMAGTQSAIANGREADEIKTGITAKIRRNTIIGMADEPAEVIDGLGNGAIATMVQFAERLDLGKVLMHCLSFAEARIRADVPPVYEVLTGRFKVPDWTVPLYIAVDSGARYPAMEGSTDPNNVSRRLLNLNANGTYWEGSNRATMADVFGYANVLCLGLKVSRVIPRAHTRYDRTDWIDLLGGDTRGQIISRFVKAWEADN